MIDFLSWPQTVISTVVKWVCTFWSVSGCSWMVLSSSWLQHWRTNTALEPVMRTVWCWTTVLGYITYFVFLKWRFWLTHLRLLWLVRQRNRAFCHWLTSLAQGALCTPQWLSVIKNSVKIKHPERVKLYVTHMALVQRW